MPAIARTGTLVSLALLAAALQAMAQDATWRSNPGSGDFNAAANWTPATVPTGTAFFGTSNTAALSFSADTTIGGWTFNADASNYSFSNGFGHRVVFNGTGIVISGGSATITNNGDLLLFAQGTTPGSAIIINNAGHTNFLNYQQCSRHGLAR